MGLYDAHCETCGRAITDGTEHCYVVRWDDGEYCRVFACARPVHVDGRLTRPCVDAARRKGETWRGRRGVRW